jgi:uncharacterized protein YqjF (DUF2071 family)
MNREVTVEAFVIGSVHSRRSELGIPRIRAMFRSERGTGTIDIASTRGRARSDVILDLDTDLATWGAIRRSASTSVNR